MALLVDPRIGEVKLFGVSEAIRRVVASWGALAQSIDRDRAIVRWPRRADVTALSGGVDWEKTIACGHRVASRGFVDRYRGSIVLGTIDPADDPIIDPVDFAARRAMIDDGAALLSSGFDLERPATMIGDFAFDLGGADFFEIRDERTRPIEGDDARWADDIRRARAILAAVAIAPAILETLLRRIGVDRPLGHQTDLRVARSARAFAALAGRTDVLSEDIDAALASAGFESADTAQSDSPAPREERDSGEAHRGDRNPGEPPNAPTPRADRESNASEQGSASSVAEPLREPDRTIASRDSVAPRISESPIPSLVVFSGGGPRGDSRGGRGPAGRRSIDRRDRTLSIAATLLRAIENRPFRAPRPGVVVNVRAADLVFRRRRPRRGTLFIFVVDGSGSMARRRMAEAKGAITRLLTEAYLRRDAVALIAVRGDRARILLEPTGAVARARRELEVLPTGGPTPLASGLLEAMSLAERERRSRRRDIVVALVTDGQANVPADHREGEPAASRRAKVAAEIERLAALWRELRLRTVVIDPTPGRDQKASASRLAHLLGADYFRMPDLDAGRLEGVVRKKQ